MLDVAEVTGTKFSRRFIILCAEIIKFSKTPPTTSTQEGCGILLHRIKCGGKQWQTTPRTCLGCSVPEPYRSHDWALVPASPASKAEY